MPSIVPQRPPTPLTEHVAFRPALLLLALGPWVGWVCGWLLDAREARATAAHAPAAVPDHADRSLICYGEGRKAR